MTTNYDEKFHELYSRYLNRELSRDEFVGAQVDLMQDCVDERADDYEALHELYDSHITCSRVGEVVSKAIEAYAERHGLVLCAGCHAVLEGDDHIEIESGSGETLRFCSVHCAEAADWHMSAYDEVWVNADGPEVIHAADGSWFADEDEAHNAGYEICAECHEWFNREDPYSEYVPIGDECYCCEECANSAGYALCERCEEWVRQSDMYSVIVNSYGDRQQWCHDCCDYYTRTCYHCDAWVEEDTAVYDDDTDEYYCPSCARRMSPAGLHEYGFTPTLKFRGDAKNSPYLGTELETDGGCDRGSYVDALDSIEGFNEHFYMTKDSSLNNGVEITSHPMTLSYHANELGEMYEKIRSTALAHGFQSHNGGRCGLHVHVNRDFFGKGIDSQDVGGYKMMRLLQRFEPNFTKFSRRRDNGWCEYSTYGTYGPDEVGEPDDISRVISKAKDMKCERKHEQALNFQHGATYEFRIFRGTLNLSTYFACLGMVNGIAHVAKMHSAHYVETVEWSQLMQDVVKACDEPKSREYLREYLEAKELL